MTTPLEHVGRQLLLIGRVYLCTPIRPWTLDELFRARISGGAGNGALCPSCRCCTQDWCDCCDCGGEGYVDDHDDWQDDGDVVRCGTCWGRGGWWSCTCDTNGKHALARGG